MYHQGSMINTHTIVLQGTQLMFTNCKIIITYVISLYIPILSGIWPILHHYCVRHSYHYRAIIKNHILNMGLVKVNLRGKGAAIFSSSI